MPKQMTPEERKAWGAKPELRSTAYRSVHQWVERRLGKPQKCEDCNNRHLNARQYHWTNLSKRYHRELSDWKRLCVKCHKKLDGYGIGTGFCKRGHNVSIVGTYTRPSGSTNCRKCKNMAKHHKINNEMVLV